MSELKKCPFCASDVSLLSSGHDGEEVYWVHCECLAPSVSDDDQEATEVWNRRASPWISVDVEPAPEEEEIDIIFDGCRMADVLIIGPNICSTQWSKEPEVICAIYGLTHWMPIPSLPEPHNKGRD